MKKTLLSLPRVMVFLMFLLHKMLQQNVNDPNLKAAPCKVCGKKVEISQQLKIDNIIFHRSVHYSSHVMFAF
jgi:hypothetical protein